MQKAGYVFKLVFPGSLNQNGLIMKRVPFFLFQETIRIGIKTGIHQEIGFVFQQFIPDSNKQSHPGFPQYPCYFPVKRRLIDVRINEIRKNHHSFFRLILHRQGI